MTDFFFWNMFTSAGLVDQRSASAVRKDCENNCKGFRKFFEGSLLSLEHTCPSAIRVLLPRL